MKNYLTKKIIAKSHLCILNKIMNNNKNKTISSKL